MDGVGVCPGMGVGAVGGGGWGGPSDVGGRFQGYPGLMEGLSPGLGSRLAVEKHVGQGLDDGWKGHCCL